MSMGYESVLGYPLFACRSMCCREDNKNQMKRNECRIGRRDKEKEWDEHGVAGPRVHGWPIQRL